MGNEYVTVVLDQGPCSLDFSLCPSLLQESVEVPFRGERASERLNMD